MEPFISLTHDPIDHAALTEKVRSPQAGALLLFLGTVREMTDGRRTLALDYDAYPEMALATMRQVAEEAAAQWPIVACGIVHRLGHLELSEASVAIAVSCAHRDVCYAAGRFMIDRLKEIVPIWKKENWDDGSTEWVHPDGSIAPTEPNT